MIEDTPITRRRLIALGGAATAVASVPGFLMPARAAAAAAEGWLTRASYTGRIGETFYASLPAGRFGLRLAAVTGDDKAFDLVFSPTSATVHPQATRTFTHAGLGRTEFFVVPFKAPKTSLKYVVSINRSH